MKNCEEGFSLLELTVAIGIAAILSTTVVLMSPGFISEIKTTVNDHSDCSFEKEEAAKSFIEGQEYSGWQSSSVGNAECTIGVE